MRGSLRTGLLALVLAWGCTQSLDVGGNGDASVDAAEVGAADVGAEDGRVSASCDTGAMLVVALRAEDSFSGPNVLARFAVSAAGVTRCPDVTAGGTLPILQGVGWLDAQRVVIGGVDGIYVVDASHDRIVAQQFFVDTSIRIVDTLGIADASGERWGVVAGDNLPDDGIDRFYLLRASDSMLRVIEATDVDTREMTSCDASPLSPGGMTCVENVVVSPAHGTEAAAKEVHPFTLAAADRWIAPVSGTTFLRIAALGDHLAWIASFGGDDDVRTSVGPLTSATVGTPTRCTTTLCASPRELVDVAVDPTRPGGYFAICRGVLDADPRFHVIRGSSESDGAACEIIVDGTTLGVGIDPSALDLRAP